MPFRLKAGGGGAKSEITGGIEFNGMTEDEVIVGAGYEAVNAHWTDFFIEAYGRGGGGISDVTAIKMVAADTIHAGTNVIFSDPSRSLYIYYSFEQTVQNGEAVLWVDGRMENIANSDEYWELAVTKANGDAWYAPPIAFTLMKEV